MAINFTSPVSRKFGCTHLTVQFKLVQLGWTHLCTSFCPLYHIFRWMYLLTIWKIWTKHSYVNSKSKALWEIPNVENVILYLQFVSLVHTHSVPNRISEVSLSQKEIQLKEHQNNIDYRLFFKVIKYILISS